jgi:hypothetical protein
VARTVRYGPSCVRTHSRSGLPQMYHHCSSKGARVGFELGHRLGAASRVGGARPGNRSPPTGPTLTLRSREDRDSVVQRPTCFVESVDFAALLSLLAFPLPDDAALG